MPDNKASAVIARIGDAGFDDEALGSLPDILSGLIDSRSCTIQFMSRDWMHFDFVWNHFTADMHVDYVREFMADDLWLRAGQTLSLNRVQNMDAFVPYEQHARSRIYNEFYRAHGDDTAHCLGTVISTPEGYVTFGIHRAHSQGVFGDPETELIQSLLPDIARLHRLRARLRSAEMRADMAKGALDRFDFAAVIVRADRRITLSNIAAEVLFRARDGLCAPFGRLSAVLPGDDKNLAQLICQATVDRPARAGGMRVERAPGMAALRIVVTPMPQPGLALVIIETSDRRASLGELAARIYGLSGAETALAEAMARGDRPEDFAANRGVRMSTVRSQLSSLLHKTGTARQSQLAALLASLPRLL